MRCQEVSHRPCIYTQAGGKLQWDEKKLCFCPAKINIASSNIGACNGSFDLSIAFREAVRAGRRATATRGHSIDAIALPVVETTKQNWQPSAAWNIPNGRQPGRGSKAFVDFQNDVTVDDIKISVDEGYRSIEHLKRYTTAGMGTDQGKTSK